MATGEMKRLPKSTSVEPHFPKAQQRLFREVLRLLRRRAIPFAVSGAFALHHHTGIWRATKDLDLFLPAEYASEALRLLEEDGFTTEVADEVWVAKAHRDGHYVDLITGMNNAALTVEIFWMERSEPYVLFGVPVRVLGLEELIASKMFVARRERFDGADICHLIYRNAGRLDWDRLLGLAMQHGDHRELLFWHLVLFRYVYPSSTGLVPANVWNELLTDFRRRLATPDGQEPFRGSLLDENMFLIDVEEWGLPNLIEDLREARQPKIEAVAGDEVGHGTARAANESKALRRP